MSILSGSLHSSKDLGIARDAMVFLPVLRFLTEEFLEEEEAVSLRFLGVGAGGGAGAPAVEEEWT